MKKARIIPCLDVKDGRVVKGVQFEGLVDAGDPVEIAQYYEKAGADEITLLDITAFTEGRKTFVDLIKNVTDNIRIPLTVGGGITSVDDCEQVLKAGAKKVSLNSAAVLNPELINDLSKNFGKASIVIAVDAKLDKNGIYRVMIKGANEETSLDVVSWAKEVEARGAGEILLTSKDCDGAKNGYDLELTRLVSESVSIPVVASGGAGKIEDFYLAFSEGKASAALAASLFHFKIVQISEVKEYLRKKGLDA